MLQCSANPASGLPSCCLVIEGYVHVADGSLGRLDRANQVAARGCNGPSILSESIAAATPISVSTGMSRTPVRDALYRLEQERYLQVHLRSGWSVRPYDFHRFEALYDLRLILEEASVIRFCDLSKRGSLESLKAIWLVPEAERLTDPKEISALDEAFHALLVAAAGNAEVARCHHEVTERIRIIRRLDFTQQHRIDTTYDEHGQILRALIRRRGESSSALSHRNPQGRGTQDHAASPLHGTVDEARVNHFV